MKLIGGLSRRRFSLKITLIYALFGGLWILFSDRILAAMASEADVITSMQTYKGWFYVLVTAVLIYGLVSQSERHLRDLLNQLDLKNRSLKDEMQARIEKEEHIRRLMRQLEQKNEELESIIYAGSHDLRTPVINLQGFSAQLTKSLDKLRMLVGDDPPLASNPQYQTLLDNEIPESLLFIQAGTEKINMLLRGLLTICLVGREPQDIRTVNIAAVLDRVLREMTHQIAQYRAVVSIEPLPDCRGDQDRLFQVFSNMIDNALKYRHPDRPPQVTVSAEQANDTVIYCVADNGIGMDPAYEETIFKMFHQLDPLVEGQGLGLTLVRRILYRLNGKITCTSEPGQGTRFYIHLPAANAR